MHGYHHEGDVQDHHLELRKALGMCRGGSLQAMGCERDCLFLL